MLHVIVVIWQYRQENKSGIVRQCKYCGADIPVATTHICDRRKTMPVVIPGLIQKTTFYQA